MAKFRIHQKRQHVRLCEYKKDKLDIFYIKSEIVKACQRLLLVSKLKGISDILKVTLMTL